MPRLPNKNNATQKSKSIQQSHTRKKVVNTADYEESEFQLFHDLELAIERRDLFDVSNILKDFQRLQYNPQQKKCYNGSTPLHIAVMSNDPRIVNFFLDNYFDPMVKNASEFSPLFLAAYNNCVLALDTIIKHKKFSEMNFGTITAYYFRTLLHTAVLGNAEAAVDYLLKQYSEDNSFLNAQDRFGETALHKAIFVRSEAITTMLLSTSIDREIRNIYGETAEDFAQQLMPTFLPAFATERFSYPDRTEVEKLISDKSHKSQKEAEDLSCDSRKVSKESVRYLTKSLVSGITHATKGLASHLVMDPELERRLNSSLKN